MQEQQTESVEGGARLQIREYKETLIMNAAADLFYERGFQRTTLDDIAAALGVTKPFIYRYFKSKHSILERLFDKAYQDLYEAVTRLRANGETDPVRRFEQFISAYVRENLARRTFSGIVLEEEKNFSADTIADMRRKQRSFDALLTSLIGDGVRAGAFDVDDAEITSLEISGMVRWTHRWYSPKGRLSADELCAHLTRTALRMVGWNELYPARPSSKLEAVTDQREDTDKS
ncbi:AcrR family transcriptional regulator [Paraburkholderia sp. HC6.4b]|uniref:TetR/AcrR family transcriptional regulator n=1 Tax=unclassified Paraburkholderia TaxID=2615204 RepID=UPI001613A974|nr:MULTISPECIES: TetR/AcrR family transcriptional regulator [unclassified Paraburkholderia]MBB5406315.1 AcrR family transcriptional regulator [Paraburkholderia sp. HC6.4b]MBB5448713.1 AcrR family transcriptional regulator [Paraburkholderia sp. Kb1A]